MTSHYKKTFMTLPLDSKWPVSKISLWTCTLTWIILDSKEFISYIPYLCLYKRFLPHRDRWETQVNFLCVCLCMGHLCVEPRDSHQISSFTRLYCIAWVRVSPHELRDSATFSSTPGLRSQALFIVPSFYNEIRSSCLGQLRSQFSA